VLWDGRETTVRHEIVRRSRRAFLGKNHDDAVFYFNGIGKYFQVMAGNRFAGGLLAITVKEA